jgi:hypothetical protein
VAERLEGSTKMDVEEIVGLVKKNCNRIMTSLDGLNRIQIRRLVHGLIKRMVVDLETREATMEVHMPSWMIKPNSDIIDSVCAENASCQPGVFCATNDYSIPIATYSCVAQRVENKFCMDCHRTSSVANSLIPTNIAA